MRITFPKFLFAALSSFCLPALAMAQSYLPLPETSAPVYRPVSSNYYSSQPTAGSLVSQVADPPMPGEATPSPSDEVVEDTVPAPGEAMPATSSGKSCKGGKGSSCGLGSNLWCMGEGLLDGVGGNCCCYYGGVYGIYWDRDRERQTQITVTNVNERDAILDNLDAEMEEEAGYQFTIGRLIHCGCAAVEVTWWDINPDTQRASVLDPNDILTDPNLLSAFDFSTLNYDDGGGATSMDGFFDNSRIHRLTRSYDMQNLEVNFVHFTACGTHGGCSKGGKGACGRRYEVSLLAGVRYFEFEEGFLLEADPTDTDFTGANDEVRYQINVENHMLGFQLGTRADYYYTQNLGLHGAFKFGMYGNDIDHHSFIGGPNGPAVVGSGPNVGREFNIRSDKKEVSFLGELDVGASYRFASNWRVRGGYRVIAVSGIATTLEQIPVYLQDIDGVENINSESSMVLHGAYAGLEYNY